MAKKTEAKPAPLPDPKPDTKPPTGNGWEDLSQSAEIEQWLGEADFTPDAPPIVATLKDALVLPDDKKGTRVVYVGELLKDAATAKAGTVVGLGEKAKLVPLRELAVGDAVALKVTGSKKLDGGRTMHLFSIKVKRGRGGRSLAAIIARAESIQRRGASVPMREPGDDQDDNGYGASLAESDPFA